MLTYRRLSAMCLFALVFALVAGLAVLLGAMLSAAQAAPLGTLKQFKVPTDNSQPRHITLGADGNLWFTESNEASLPLHPNVGRITPTGDPRRQSLSSASTAVLAQRHRAGAGRRTLLHPERSRSGANNDLGRGPARRGPRGREGNPISTYRQWHRRTW